MIRIFAILYLMIFVVAASIFAAHIPPNWLAFSLSALGMIFCIILIRKQHKAELTHSTNQENPLHVFIQLTKKSSDLAEYLLKIEKWNSEMMSKLENHSESLSTKMQQIHEGLIELLGMKKFILVILPFARAERLLNRALSAATDGYFEEAKISLQESIPFWQEVNHVLNNLKKQAD